MKIGVPKEKKNHEYRVGLVPEAVHELTLLGHDVFVEQDAGFGAGCSNEDYEKAGAKICSNPKEVFDSSELIIKVKEPQLDEIKLLHEGQILFTYLHLAAAPEITKGLLDTKCIAIAYETITDKNGQLPLLAPMSEVAGRLSVQQGIYCLEKQNGGAGILLGGVPGVAPAKVLVIGGGRAGTNAALMAVGLEADVTIIDKSIHRLHELNLIFGQKVKTIYSTHDSIDYHAKNVDLVIGSVLIPGASAPKLLKEETVKSMRDGSVFVDIAIDQGGCSETSKPTTHENPSYIEHGVVHYCVTNMPSAVARTSAFALNNATLPYILKLANNGLDALKKDSDFLEGLNTYKGHVTCKEVAEDLGYEHIAPQEALKS